MKTNCGQSIVSCLFVAVWLACPASDRLVADDVQLNLIETFFKVERESADARRVRLEAIAAEREDNRVEKLKLEYLLQQWNDILPPGPRARDLAPLQQRSLDRAQKLADSNSSVIDFQANQNAIRSGRAINSLLVILGPIAHRKSMQPPTPESEMHFASLRESNRISKEDASHFVLVPFGSDDGQAQVRLNQEPLTIIWRGVIQDHFPSYIKNIEKCRVDFVQALQPGAEQAGGEIQRTAVRMDDQVALLMKELIAKKQQAVEYRDGTGGRSRFVRWQDWNSAFDDLKRLRSTIQYFRDAPNALAVKRFDGGNIEEFVCFSYHHGLVFSPSRPADAEAYLKVFQLLQQYFRDIQLVGDYRKQIERDLEKLEIEDAQLLHEATAEKVFP
jgi:hypothetical protein